MLRVYLTLLAATRKWYSKLGGKKGDPSNPADPYMTLVGYFNSLRELGGARRLIEVEVRNRLAGYATRLRVGEAEGLYENRPIDYEPVELTSRVSTAQASEAKRRLSLPHTEKEHVDVAIATNMISVGLDITRLGLMVVFGQPKASAEYIQATGRVGREYERPGLVVTILNIHKPRDRSHYERFAAYHESLPHETTASGRATRRASSDPACILRVFLLARAVGERDRSGLRRTIGRGLSSVDIHAPNGGYHTQPAPSGGPS
jgi:hypothetical protein